MNRLTYAVSILFACAFVSLATTLLWRVYPPPGLIDTRAYLEAARRLTTTGTPYHPALFEGPIPNVPENIPIAYLYPPPLAQVFTILLPLGDEWVTFGWAYVQVVLIAILMPALYWTYAGRLTPTRFAFIVGAMFAYFPLQYAAYEGNVSGWIAITVTLMIMRGPAIFGTGAALLAILKLTPAVFLAPALLRHRARGPTVAVGSAVLGLSVLVAPTAWLDWVGALPNIVRFPMAPSPANISLGHLMEPLGLVVMGTAISSSVGLTALALAASWAWRGRDIRAVTVGATIALLAIPASLFDHYMALLFPLVLSVWAVSAGRSRVLFIVGMVAQSTFWVGLMPYVAFGGTALVCLTLVFEAFRLANGTIKLQTVPDRTSDPAATTPIPDSWKLRSRAVQ